MSLDRIIKVKQTTGATCTVGGLSMANDTWYDVVDDEGRIALFNDRKTKEYLFTDPPKVHISNGDIELLGQAAYDWISVKTKQDLDGRHLSHSTPRYLGTYTYFTSYDDDHSDPHSVGGDDTCALMWDITTQSANPTNVYLDFNTVKNDTYVRQGDITWEDAKFDTISMDIVPKTTDYVSTTSGTTYDLYGGYLITPNPYGTGLIQVAENDMVPVEMTPNEFGSYPAGYWDAEWNETTKKYDNITPNYLGTGGYNMFGEEVKLYRFLNKKMLLGSHTKICPTDDSSQIGHNMRLKMTLETYGVPHPWRGCGTVMMYRSRTV